MSDEYDINEAHCPQCSNDHTHSRPCSCEDGYTSRYEDDPLWYDKDDLWPCDDCQAKGYFHWCPKCGFDLAAHNELKTK